MTRRHWRPFRAAGDAARAAIHDAGAHVAATITTTATSTARVAAGALVLGLLAGAALVWVGVSIARQAT